uniref:FAD-dependent oxidoreductase n=1 Tax=Chitinophaga sancti TaxID=1004 RepID=UPI003F7A4900
MRKLTLLLPLFITARLFAQNIREVDICIYGGTSAGVIAGYTAKKMNKSVLVIEPGKRLGGLTSGGLGYTDIGNKYAITGLSRDFYRRIGKHYGRFETWIFEPGVAEQTFQQYIKEGGVEVLYQQPITAAKKEGKRVAEIQTAATIIRAKMFIDCSYEGDLMAKAGISYTVGREDNAQYGETYNGAQLREKHQFPDGIDPYKEPGNPASGLLWGISPEQVEKQGTGNKKIQAYNFRICLTNEPGNLIPIAKPLDYDPARYELLLRVVQKSQPGN